METQLYTVPCYFGNTEFDRNSGIELFSDWLINAIFCEIQDKYQIPDEKMESLKELGCYGYTLNSVESVLPREKYLELVYINEGWGKYIVPLPALYDLLANHYAKFFINYTLKLASLKESTAKDENEAFNEMHKTYNKSINEIKETNIYAESWDEILGLFEGECYIDEEIVKIYLSLPNNKTGFSEFYKDKAAFDKLKKSVNDPYDLNRLLDYLKGLNAESFKHLDDSDERAQDFYICVYKAILKNLADHFEWSEDALYEDSEFGGYAAYSSLAAENIGNSAFNTFTEMLLENNANKLREFIKYEWNEIGPLPKIQFEELVEKVINVPEMQAFIKANATVQSDKAESKEITKEDVLEAIKAYDEGKRPENCGTSKTVFLVHNGKTYPIKAIYALATGVEGGSFHIKAEKTLKNLGFTIARTE